MIGTRARLALCRFARPLPRPGPRCSRVHAGFSAMRAYPSAAPVTTPSKRPSTQRISGIRSSAATMWISEVPGFVKQTSTPPASSVRIRLSAPFILSSLQIFSKLAKNRPKRLKNDVSLSLHHGYNSHKRFLPMRSVNVAELKNRLSKYLTFAKSGEEIIIRDRNLPVAKLVPFTSDDASEEELLLVAAGKMRMPKSPVKVEKLLKIPTGRVARSEAIQALLNERDDGL